MQESFFTTAAQETGLDLAAVRRDGDLLELVDRAFRMGRHQPLPGAVRQQVHFLQQRLADQHFIAQDQRVVAGTPLHDLEAHTFRDADGALAAIREFDGHLVVWFDTQPLQ